MKRVKLFAKRGLALFMTLVMLMALAPAVVLAEGETATKKLSELLTDFSDSEKAIIAANDETYTYTAPGADAVTVDDANKQVTASYDGWTAVSYAVQGVTYDMADTYSVAGNDPYGVDVLFRLTKPVANADAINAEFVRYASLKAGLANMAALKDITATLNTLAPQFLDENNRWLLEALNAGDEAYHAGLNGIYAELEGNGKKFVLDDLMAGYNTDTPSVVWLAANDEAVKSANGNTLSKFLQLTTSTTWGKVSNNTQFKTIVDLVNGLVTNMQAAADADWSCTSCSESDDSITSAVQAFERSGNPVPSAVTVAEATVTKQVGQGTIHIVVVAKVADTPDSNELTDVTLAEEDVNFKEGLTLAEIVEEDSFKTALAGAKAAAKSEENVGKYGLSDTNYTEAAASYDATHALQQDETVNYTVTYTANNIAGYTITEGGDTADTKSDLPYGYQLTLPKASSGREYTYYISGEEKAQGEVITLKEANVAISRVELAEVKAFELDELLANSNVTVNDVEKSILTNGAVYTDTVTLRRPDETDKLVTVTQEGTNYTVAANTYPSTMGDASWVPDTYEALDANGNVTKSGSFTGGAATFPMDNAVDQVKVTYKLEIGAGVSDATVNEVLKLPTQLIVDAKAQAEALDELAALSDLNITTEQGNQIKTAKGVIESGSDLQQETIDAYADLVANCLNGSSQFKLKVLLNSYEQQGLAYYYKNSSSFLTQIDKLYADLEAVNADWTAVEALLAENNMADRAANLKSRFDAIRNALTAAKATLEDDHPIHNINANIADVENLVAILRSHTLADASYTKNGAPALYQTVSAPAPGRAKVSVTVTLGDRDPVSFAAFVSTDGVTAAQKTRIDAQVEDVIGSANIEKELYDITTDCPAVGTAGIAQGTQYTVTGTPIEFTVYLRDKASGAVDADALATITVESREVELEGRGVEYTYTYEVNGDSVPVGTYAFTADQLKTAKAAENKLYVDYTRKDLVEDLVDKLNQAVIDGGLTLNGSGMATFLLGKNTAGDKTLVLRLTPGYESGMQSKLKDALQNAATELSAAGLYVGSDYGTIWDTEKLALQPIVDLVLNSGMSLDTILAMLKESGDFNEYDLSGVTIVNSAYRTDVIGAYMMDTTLQVGTETDKTPIKVYVTMEDFDQQTSNLKNLRKGTAKLRSYGNIKLADDAINLDLYSGAGTAAYLSAALALGYTDISDIDGKFQDVEYLDFMIGIIDELLADASIDMDTYLNTAKEISDRDLGLDGMNKYYGKLRKVLNELRSNSTGDPSAYTYTGLPAKLNSLGVSDTLQGLIKDKDGIAYAVQINCEKDQTALVLDPHAGGVHKVKFVKGEANVQAAIDAAGEDSVVILLDTFDGSLSISKNIIFDLNGQTVTGDIQSTASDRVIIVDSTLDNHGVVKGTVSGMLKITGGTFESDSAKHFLPNDYQIDSDGRVNNNLYTIEVNGDDVDVILNADRITLYGFPTPKAVAVELAFDLALNYYTSAALMVDNEFYTMGMDDVAHLLGNITEDDANGVLQKLNMDGINAFIAKTIGVMTDFSSLKTAFENGGDITSYSYKTNYWTIGIENNDAAHKLDVNVGAAADKAAHEGTITIKAGGTAENRQTVAKLLEKLADVTTFDVQPSLVLDQPAYGSKTLFTKGAAAGEVTFDLTRGNVGDDNYAIAIAVIAANGLDGAKKDALVKAINAYYTTDKGNLTDLHDAFNALSNGDLITAISKYRRTTDFGTILDSLNLDPAAEQAVTELADIYWAFLVTLSKAVRLSGLGGTGALMETYEVDTDANYGVYSITKSVAKNPERTVRGYTLDATGIVDSGKVTVKLFPKTDVIIELYDENDALQKSYYSKSDIVKAFGAAEDGYTIKLLADGIELTENVTIAADKAISLDVNAKTFAMSDGVTITLARDGAKKAALTVVNCDPELALDKFVSGSQWSEAVKNGSTYTLQALTPEIGVPVVTGLESYEGAKVENGIIILDIVNRDSSNNRLNGSITETEFKAQVVPAEVKNASETDKALTGVTGEGYVPTGAKAAFTATNPDYAADNPTAAAVTAAYDIVIIGDVSKDGKLYNNDASLMCRSYLKFIELDDLQKIAADVMCDNKEANNDASQAMIKYLFVDQYSTHLK